MYFTWGSYRFPDNEVSLSTYTDESQYNARGVRTSVMSRMSIEGEIKISNPTQASMKDEIQERQEALQSDYHDAILWHDNGTRSAHVLLNSASISGVRVVSMSFPNGDGSEYATRRTWQAVIEGNFPAVIDGLVAFNETVSVRGTGGRRIVHIETLNSPPVRQVTAQRTKVSMSQQGSAVGWSRYPVAPAPLWPGDLLHEQVEISRGNPEFNGRAYRFYEISWRYAFEASFPAFGIPNRRTIV